MTLKSKARWKWLLVLPAAVGAWAGLQLLLALLISIPFYRDLVMFGGDVDLMLKEFVYSGAAPYWFVMAGAHTAPSHRTTTAVSLSCLLVGVYVVLRLFLGIGGYLPVFWLVVSSVVTICAVAIASFQISNEIDSVNRLGKVHSHPAA